MSNGPARSSRYRGLDPIDKRPAAAARFADEIEAATLPGSASRTSIAGAIDYAVPLFDDNGYQGMRRVIDISGDGPNNAGRSGDGRPRRRPGPGHHHQRPAADDQLFPSLFVIEELDRLLPDCVIGGPGAFMIPVNDWAQFPEAIRRKLVLELAGPLSPAWFRVAESRHREGFRPHRVPTASSARRCGATAAGCRDRALKRPHAASNCLRSSRSCCGERA